MGLRHSRRDPRAASERRSRRVRAARAGHRIAMQHPQSTCFVQRFHCPLASHPFMMKASSSSQLQGGPAMKCSVCGSESNVDARFCANCGAKVNPGADTLFKTPVSPPPTAAAPVSDAGADASAAPRATNLVPVLLVLAALVVVGYFAYRALLPE